MFPKNLTVFKLDDEHKNIALADLQTAFAKKPFNDCLLNETLSFGFIAPLENDDRLVIEVMPSVFMFCLQKQSKILPNDVIRDLVAKEIKLLEEKNGFKLKRVEELEVKDNLIFKLIPTALPKNTKTYAYLNAKDGWLIINNASSSKAEDLVKILRSLINGQIDMVDEANAEGELTRQSVLKALPLRKIVANNNVSQLLTRWIEYPTMTEEFNAFNFDDECQLKGGEGDDRVISFKNTLLNSKEVASYIRDGMRVTKLGMTWRDKIAFVLDENLAIKRVEFLSILTRPEKYEGTESDADRFIVDAVIVAEEVKQLLDDLVSAFGGFNE